MHTVEIELAAKWEVIRNPIVRNAPIRLRYPNSSRSTLTLAACISKRCALKASGNGGYSMKNGRSAEVTLTHWVTQCLPPNS
jgi:hypothetical protein